MKNICLALVIMLAAASSAFAQGVLPAEIRIKVNGLVCDFCARNVNKVFSKEKAVRSVDVDLDRKIVTLALEPAATLEDEMIRKMIRDAGYQVVLIDRGEADAAP